jgi:hypothetical protein
VRCCTSSRWLVRALTSATLLLASAAAAPSIAAAQPTSAESYAGRRAVVLAREGIQLYEAGAWAAAEAKLTEAEALSHSPVFLLYVARSRRNAGRLLDARDMYRRVAGEALAPSAPPPWHQALVDARAELTVLEPTIPSIAVRVADGGPATQAAIDGRPVPLGTAVEVDPGARQVIVTDGARRLDAQVDVRPGERDRWVDVSFAAPPYAAGSPGRSGGSWVPGAVVLGLGVVGLGVGAVTGAVALGESGSIEDECPEGACPASVAPGARDEQLSDAHTMADVSTIAFIAGGALTGAGVVLLVVRPFGGDAVQVRAGGRSVALRGSF